MKKSKPLKTLEALIPDVVFSPTPAQRKVKALFWIKLEAAPFVDRESLTRAHIEDVLGKSLPNDWWREPGFQDWFEEKEEFRVKAKAMASTLLDHAYDMATNPDMNASARVNAMKLILEASKQVQTKEDSRLDNELEKLGVKDADRLIAKYLKEVP